MKNLLPLNVVRKKNVVRQFEEHKGVNEMFGKIKLQARIKELELILARVEKQRDQWKESCDSAWDCKQEALDEVTQLQHENKSLSQELENERVERMALEEAEASMVEALPGLEEENKRLIECLRAESTRMREGKYRMDGEHLTVKDLVRVLREEIACHAAELKQAQEAVKAAFTLLKPYIGE